MKEESFKCIRCGACCKQAKNIVDLIPDLFVVFQPDNQGHCRFLRKDKSGKYECNIYDKRPDICRVEKCVETMSKITGISQEEFSKFTNHFCSVLRQGLTKKE